MELIGKIITLKPLQKSFFTEYHQMFSPTVRQTLGLPPVCDVQDTINFLKTAMVDEQHLMFYCIFDNQTNTLIGAIVIRSQEHPNGQLGAWLNENFWGGGRYQEALYLMMKKYFESDAHDSIFAFIDEGNKRSLRAHQKFGFRIVDKSSHDDKKYCPGKKTNKVVLTRENFEQIRYWDETK